MTRPRCFVVDHHVEQPGLERQHAAGQVGVHQPDRAQAHQAEFGAQLDELAQAPRALAGQAGDVFPLLAAAQARGVDALAEQFAVQRAHLHIGFGEAGNPGPGFVLAEQQFRIVLFQALLPAQPRFAVEHAAHRGFECFGGNRVESFLALAQQGQEFQVGGFELVGAATEALVGDQLRQRLAQAAEGRQVALVAGDGAVQLFQQFVAEPVGEHLEFVQAELACGLADQRGVEVAEQRFEALFLAGEDHRVELLGARRLGQATSQGLDLAQLLAGVAGQAGQFRTGIGGDCRQPQALLQRRQLPAQRPPLALQAAGAEEGGQAAVVVGLAVLAQETP